MKKTILAAAFLVGVLSSCSEQKTAETAHTEHDTATAEEQLVVVDTPDYSAAAEPVKSQLTQLLQNYMSLKDALVASDAAAAKTAAATVLTAAEAIPVTALAGDEQKFAQEKAQAVKQAATAIAGAADLEAQRAHLQQLSEATFALTKAFGATSDKLYYQHCPMALNDKGAYWISMKKEIRNPYFGDAMLKCGSNEEVYN